MAGKTKQPSKGSDKTKNGCPTARHEEYPTKCADISFTKDCKPYECPEKCECETDDAVNHIYGHFMNEKPPELGPAPTDYERVVFFEIYFEISKGLTIKTLDYDYSKCGDQIKCDKKVSHGERHKLAKQKFREIYAATDPNLPPKQQFNLQNYQNIIVEAYNVKMKSKKIKTKSIDGLDDMICQLAAFNEYYPFPSPFDVNFTGPTAIIAQS